MMNPSPRRRGEFVLTQKSKIIQMKKQILRLTLFAGCLAVVLTACQKDSVDNTDYTTEVSTHSDDQSNFSDDMDATVNDANALLESSPSFTGRPGDIQTLLCNATVVFDSTSNPRTITITYNGLNCQGNLSRTGVVVISMPANVHWRDPGAAITVTYTNLRITRVRDNKSITINGSHVYTNVSGGLLINLPTLGTIRHTLTSNGMTITFDNNTQRTWQIAKERVFTYNNGIVITARGTQTVGSETNVAEWGTNRFGRSFTTSTVSPIIIRQDCNFRITAGELKHTTPVVTATAKFGLDAQGNPTTCPGPNPYYMKITWTGPNGTRTVIIPY
jgi:hypothetical protein